MPRLRNASLDSGATAAKVRTLLVVQLLGALVRPTRSIPLGPRMGQIASLSPLFRRSTILTVHRDVSSLVHALRNGPVLEKEHRLPAFRFNKSFLHSAGRKGIREPTERPHTRAGTRNT